MAMTLRLTEEQDKVLSALAEATGVSKQEAAVRAIMDTAARSSKDAEVRALARRAATRYDVLLDRLSQ